MIEKSRSAPLWPVIPNYAPNLFAGTARYYAKYRPPYPEKMIADLRELAGLSGDGVLLDLACGTGEVALAMSRYFREILAVDQEPEMIEVAIEKAQQADITNVWWSTGRAEDLDLAPHSLEMITVGNAFHRLDRRAVAAQAMSALEPEGCFVVLGSSSLWSGRTPWLRDVVKLVDGWSAPTPTLGVESDVTEGSETSPPPVRLTHEQVLADQGFAEVREYQFPTAHSWTIDNFVGYLHSTSVITNIPEDRRGDFEADLRTLLRSISAEHGLSEIIDFYYILARRELRSI